MLFLSQIDVFLLSMKTSTKIISLLAIASGIVITYNIIQRRRKKPPIFFKKELAKNYNARTIPPFGIFIKESEKDNKELIDHEIVHWKQYQNKGLIRFYIDYAKEMKELGYDKMPMEKEARVNESEYCQNNYTECVRNGQAKTVYNPNFRL